MRQGYTTWGPVRGDCGHLHDTQSAAEICAGLDAEGCAEQGGYSDRLVHACTAEELRNYDVTRGPGRLVEGWEDAE